MAEVFREVNKKIHFIGIGGIGMSGIAKLFLRRGMKVCGSDLKLNNVVEELIGMGAEIFINHRSSNIKDADMVVYSSAIKEDNPEFIEARRLGIPLIKRAQALAELMKDKIVITVTGSHGKTTTTSLASYLLLETGFFPTVAIGGILMNINNNVYQGDGEFFVAEADESDGSFLYYRPRYSIITNVDYEHLDYYKDFDNLINTYREFLDKTSVDGCVFSCSDDVNLKKILRDYKNRNIFFGLGEGADIYARNMEIKALSSEFDCFWKNKFIDRFFLPLGGMHNISNALSVIALGLELKIDLTFIKKALSGYKGVRRRLEVKFKNDDFMVLDDYAHHPTELKATLSAVKNLKYRRTIAVFQPHRYSRTKLLLEEFSRSFDLADYVIVTDIYPAGEKLIEGISGRRVYEKIKEYSPDKQLCFLANEEIVSHIINILQPEDLVITLGAGDIIKTCDELVEELKRKS